MKSRWAGVAVAAPHWLQLREAASSHTTVPVMIVLRVNGI
jgi:hypothetical protein